MPCEFLAVLGGRRWRVVDGDASLDENDRGTCDPPDRKAKKIRIAPDLKGEEHLEVAIHEALHALSWHQFDESWVDQSGKELARVLYRLGYRRTVTRGSPDSPDSPGSRDARDRTDSCP